MLLSAAGLVAVAAAHGYPQQVNSAIQDRYERELGRIVQQIVHGYGPERVLVFGSAARGDVGEDSDIDLLVVKRTPKRWIERGVEAMLVVDTAVPLDIVVYTPEEFEERTRSSDPNFREMLAQARTVYDARVT